MTEYEIEEAEANKAFEQMKAAQAEAFRAAVYGTAAEAAKANAAFNTARLIFKAARCASDAAFDAQ